MAGVYVQRQGWSCVSGWQRMHWNGLTKWSDRCGPREWPKHSSTAGVLISNHYLPHSHSYAQINHSYLTQPHFNLHIQRKLYHSSAMCEFNGQWYHLNEQGYKQRPACGEMSCMPAAEWNSLSVALFFRKVGPQVGNAFIGSLESFWLNLACIRHQEREI